MLENIQVAPQDPRIQIVADAEQGSPFAQVAAADMYYAEAEYDDAFYWYSLAVRAFADQQNYYSEAILRYEVSAAECQLADMYFNGLGTDTDKTMAFNLYSQAGRRRFVKAQVQLGMMYAYAEGIKQHFGLSYAWLTAAQLNGDSSKDVVQVLKMIAAKMDSAALDNARKMAEQWVDEATLAQLAEQKKNRFDFITRWFK